MISVPTFFAVSEDLPHADDFLFAQRCLEGEEKAISQFEKKYQPIVLAYLRQKGADEDEADELSGTICADLLGKRAGRSPRLATYAGKASIKTWLRPFALNRFLALKKANQARRMIEQPGVDFETLKGSEPEVDEFETELPLIELMKDALETGFSACPAEEFVLLHLAYMDELHLRELSMMFHTPPSTIDRHLQRAKRKVAKATIGRIRELDPLLDLKWRDFKMLCRVASPACLGVVDETED